MGVARYFPRPVWYTDSCTKSNSQTKHGRKGWLGYEAQHEVWSPHWSTQWDYHHGGGLSLNDLLNWALTQLYDKSVTMPNTMITTTLLLKSFGNKWSNLSYE